MREETMTREAQNALFSENGFTITDTEIFYPGPPYQSAPTQEDLCHVSGITYGANLFKTRHWVHFTVFRPGVGRWGSDDHVMCFAWFP